MGDAAAAASVAGVPTAATAAATSQTATTPITPTPDITTDEPGPRLDPPEHRPGHVQSLPRLRIGHHRADDAALDQIQVPSPGTGLVLGYGQSRQPVMVRLFRPEPTRMTLIGGLWISQVIAFRALALGARLAVFTGRPGVWRGFGLWATSRDDRVVVLPADRPVVITGTSPLTPALLLFDGDVLGASVRPPLGPWQTQLTVLPQLTAYGFPAVQESNAVITQRLDSEESKAAASVLHLTSETAGLLQMMTEDMVATFGGGVNSYVWVSPTGVERFQFGVARR